MEDQQRQNADVMSVNYYDNYFGWKPSNDCEFQETNAFHLQGFSKGLLTGTLSRNIETNDWLRAINYYDYRGKLIQTFFTNHKGNIERSDFQYRFNGEVLKMRLVHEGITEIYDYTYDHIGRKTAFKHEKDGIRKTIAGYEYDNIGRLKSKAFCPIYQTGSKKTGEWTNPDTWGNNSIPTINDNVVIVGGHTITIPQSTIANANNLRIQNGILENFGTLNLGNFNALLSKAQKSNNLTTISSALEIVDYKYHIRNFLRGINLDANDNLTDKMFSFKLLYEDANLYDGNIGKQEWKSSIDNISRSFTYTYDGSSRIKSGIYESGKAGENYSLNNVTYDFNGNITNLSRNGWKSDNTFGLIDNLSYTYQSNSNKIQAVTDASNETASFTDATGTTDYTYSLDGSLTSDANKGITVIEYNYLKKPRRVVRNGVEILYQYAANGNKLRETTGTDFTDYLGNIIKKNDVIYQISHDEGRIIDGEYEYNIKDHLGNLRVAFRDSLGIAKISQYYAYGVWGEDLPTLSYLKSSWKADNFKFTGKENLQGTGFIDFGARWYDNIVPRFTTIDPLSELSRRFSPTVYGNDNPVLMIDPDGMRSTNSIQKAWDDTAEGTSSTWTNDGSGGFSDDPPTAANVNKSTNYDKLATGTNVTSGIYSGTKLEEVLVKGKKSNAFDESIRNFGSAGYNRRYFPRNPNDHNDYGPFVSFFALHAFEMKYTSPIGLYFGAGYVSLRGQGKFYLISNPPTMGMAMSFGGSSTGWSGSYIAGNPLSKNTTTGDYRGWSSSISGQYGGYGVGTSVSQSFDSTTGFSKSTDGFRTYSISTGSSAGAGYEYNYTYFPFK